MGMLSLADILLTDAQVSYKENRIIIYFKVNAEVNLAFKEHIQSLYNRFIKQETILVSCFIILDVIGLMIDFTQGVFFPSIRCFAIFQIDPLRFVPYIQFLEIHIFYEVRYWVC